MTVPNPTRLPGDPIPPPPQPYPWKVGVSMVGLVVLVVAVVWLAFQALKGPPTAAEFPSPATMTAVTRAFEATVSAAGTAQPRPSATPRPATPQPAEQPTAAPTSASAPTRAPAPQVAPGSTTEPAKTQQPAAPAAGAATSAPTSVAGQAQSVATQALPARTATAVAASAGGSTTSTQEPTVPPELAQQILDAYKQYWQVKADAFYALDASALSQVAAGTELARLQQQIATEQAKGRALHIKGHHDFAVVSAQDDRAQVSDDYRDLSVLIDPVTHDPLPGEAEPSSLDTAPEFNVLVDLELFAGTWKVTDGVQLVANGAGQ